MICFPYIISLMDATGRPDTSVENVQLLRFGKDKGILVDGKDIKIIDMGHSADAQKITKFYVHEPTPNMAGILARISQYKHMPTLVGVFRDVGQHCYEDLLEIQIRAETERKSAGNLKELIYSGDSWQV